MQKKRLLYGLGVVIMVLSLITAAYIHESWVKTHTKVVESWFDFSDAAPLVWVDAFTQRDFAKCDSLVPDQDSRLYSPLVLTQSHDSRYYDLVLKGLVNCVSNVKLISIDGDSYQLAISLTKYDEFSGLGSEAVTSLRERFMDGGVEEFDFTLELSDIYYETFEEMCFSLGTERVDVIAVLRVVELDGVDYVTGTSEFIDLLLSESGLLYNISLYETDIKNEVTLILEE